MCAMVGGVCAAIHLLAACALSAPPIVRSKTVQLAIRRSPWLAIDARVCRAIVDCGLISAPRAHVHEIGVITDALIAARIKNIEARLDGTLNCGLLNVAGPTAGGLASIKEARCRGPQPSLGILVALFAIIHSKRLCIRLCGLLVAPTAVVGVGGLTSLGFKDALPVPEEE